VVYPDYRTHSSYLLHGTPTSRLACRDNNVQNIPRDPRLRGSYKARDGYVILECDYSQAELRSLAALSQCTALMEIFISGKDLHNEFSTFLFGPKFTREEKMAAKTVNFGIPYGREAPSIAADPQLNTKMDVTIKMAQSWIDGWAARFPGAWDFIQKCRMAPVRGETITTCFGNKKRPGVVSREKLKDLQNESANFPHQSIASNCTIRAGIELVEPLERDYDTYIINTVHDCIVMETPLNMPHIHTVAKFVMDKMREIPARFAQLNTIPWKAEAEVGHHWGNMYKLHELKGLDTYDLATLPKYVPAH
jgi:DNA polymerase-1